MYNYGEKSSQVSRISYKDDIILNGEVCGVTVLGALGVDDHKFDSPDQVNDFSRGLSLIIKPTSINYPIDNYQG